MKFTFNLINVGLGNNGGSFSLVRSANVLSNLGHEVIIIDSVKNQHTWTPLLVKHIIIKDVKDIPDADILIGTGFKSYKSTIELPDRCGKKAIWIRGYELWQASEKEIINILSNKKVTKIVNSFGLQNKLKQFNIESYIVRPGNDFENFYPLNIRDDSKIVLGALYHTRHKTKRTDMAIQISNILKSKYKNIELWMFGTNKDSKNPNIDKYIQLPNMEEKNKFYNSVDIWLSTSDLEGLHIVPQEAMLTECVVVTSNAELAGTSDYIINNETGLVADNNLKSFVKQTEKLILDSNLRRTLGVKGKNKIIELGSREENMKKMVELFRKV